MAQSLSISSTSWPNKVLPATPAIIVEPLLGEGGYVVAPPEFLHGPRDCDQHGILLIVKGVQSGFGLNRQILYD